MRCGGLAASLASLHWMPVAHSHYPTPPPAVTSKNVSRWNQMSPGGQKHPQLRGTAFVFLADTFPVGSGAEPLVPSSILDALVRKQPGAGSGQDDGTRPRGASSAPPFILRHTGRWTQAGRQQQRPPRSWVMKEAPGQCGCVLKMLCLQQPNVAFVTGRAFTQSCCLHIAKLSASANGLQGQGWPSSIFKMIQVSWRTK